MSAFEYRQAEEIRDVFSKYNVAYLFIGKSGAILLGTFKIYTFGALGVLRLFRKRGEAITIGGGGLVRFFLVVGHQIGLSLSVIFLSDLIEFWFIKH